ncbi:MAG: flagellar FliL protein [Pseudohongiellaceae bacterium]|jgi:flagellar FliL protein
MKIIGTIFMARFVIAMCCLYLTGASAAQDLRESVYVDISPSFVTNYDEGARLKYLKARVSLKVEAESEMIIWHHLPSIQNALVILFSSQAEENLTSTVGRESLRREALQEVRNIMSTLENAGSEKIEELYFTDFIVQQ